MSTARTSLRDRFIAFDDSLQAVGVPPCTPWWRESIGGWLDEYEHRHVLELWGCAGRGSAKSSALYKLALFFTLVGDFTVPPAERHWAIVLSALKGEAEKGLAIISGWLGLLNAKVTIPYSVNGDTIEINVHDGDKVSLRGIRVVAASVQSTSGWRSYFVGIDERSKVGGLVDERDDEEIDVSAASMTSSHAFAPMISFGSAWGSEGKFFDTITRGTVPGEVYVIGPVPTWIAAPHLREEDLRRKIRSPSKFAREIKCDFQAGISEVFSAEEVALAFDFAERHRLSEPFGRVACLDMSKGLGKDAIAFCVGAWRILHDAAGQPLRRVLCFDTVEGRDRGRDGKTLEQIVEEIMQRMLTWEGIVGVWHDGFESGVVETVAYRHGFKGKLHERTWTGERKSLAVGKLCTLLEDRQVLFLADDGKLKKEFENFSEVMHPTTKHLSWKARGRGRDDRILAVLLACAVEADVKKYTEGNRTVVDRIPGSPHRGKKTWQESFREKELRERPKVIAPVIPDYRIPQTTKEPA